MIVSLPPGFLDRSLAHRGLHGPTGAGVENSAASFDAAISGGYGIELDVQLTSDNVAVVFHDYTLDRLCGRSGRVRDLTAADLSDITLKGSTQTIQTLDEILARIDGQAPVLVEIKDQDGLMGLNIGPLEADVSRSIRAYHGDIAVMSFNPNSVAALDVDCARGLVTAAYSADDWPTIPAARRAELAQIPDLATIQASFISHELADLASTQVAAVRAAGHSILTWTVRSPQDEATARKYADNITFEGYRA